MTSNELVYDAISPYGYPGILFKSFINDERNALREALYLFINELNKKLICCAFIRLNNFEYFNKKILSEYGDVVFKGQTVWIDLTKPKEERLKKMRLNHIRIIKKLNSLNMKFYIDEDWSKINNFIDMYNKHLNLIKARSIYFYSKEYFYFLKNNFNNILHHFYIEYEGEYVCGGLFSSLNEIIEYHFGVTLISARKYSPHRLMIEKICEWGSINGKKKLHLGGGVGAKADNLFHYKAGFSKDRSAYNVWNIIVEENTYKKVVDKYLNKFVDHSDDRLFFPRYRQFLTK